MKGRNRDRAGIVMGGERNASLPATASDPLEGIEHAIEVTHFVPPSQTRARSVSS